MAILYEHLKLRDGCSRVIALEGEKTVGFGDASLQSDGMVLLENLHVDEIKRRNGIGSSIISHLCRLGTDRGAESMVVDFRPYPSELTESLRFYRSNGFELINGKLSKRI